jgi:hypothetical protein
VRVDGNLTIPSNPSLTLALDGAFVVNSRTARCAPGNGTRYRIYRRLYGPQGRSGPVQKISLLPGFNLQTFEPVANFYTNYIIPVHVKKFRNYFCAGNSVIHAGVTPI